VLAVPVVGTRSFLAACAIALSAAVILVPNAGAVRIGEVSLEPSSGPVDVVTGPDGNLFVAEQGLDRVDRVRPDGGIIGQFALPAGSDPFAITAGPDGNLWVSEFGAKKIARVTTAGGINQFPEGTTSGSPRGIAAGPDGNIWIAESGPDTVGRLRLSDSNFQQFAATGGLRDIVAGPDGNLWFTKGFGAIGRITPAGVLLPDFSAGISPGASPNSIALGPDGNIWFTENAGIGRITPAGTVTEFSLVPNDDPSAKITAGPDGNLWFTQFNDDRVGRISPDGTITLFTQGITAGGSPSGISTGPDGRIWYAQFNGHRLGIVTLEPPTAITGGASSIRHDSASVIATVNPLDYPTTVTFEYGPSAAYGSSAAPVALAAGSADVVVPGELTGLTPQSTVHFRVVASSAVGTTMGSDLTLATAAAPPLRRITTPIRSRFALFARFTRVTRLKVLRVPADARIQLRCKGRGCFRGVKRVTLGRAASSVDLRRRFLRRARLRPRAVLEVRVLAPASIGKVVRFTIRRTKLPRRRVLCLPPNATRATRC
jgi:streptogramin lyase